MEEGSDEEVKESAMQVLKNIYGGSVKQPTACAVSRWGGDPFSRGQTFLSFVFATSGQIRTRFGHLWRCVCELSYLYDPTAQQPTACAMTW